MEKDSTVLLIDDIDSDVELTRRTLARGGLIDKLVRVQDAQQALESLEASRASPDELPTLILLEVNIRKLSSLEFVKRLRGDPALKRIPIVLLTVATATLVVGAYRRFGVTNMLLKPVELGAFRDAAIPHGVRFSR